MKKFTLFATLILIGFSMIHAQNYQTYFSDRIIAFGKDHAELKFQKVDSVNINQEDSIFWFFPNFALVDYWCLQPDGPNWSGRKVIIRENGDNVFFNRYDDTILIKTQAELHYPWLAYDDTDNYKIFAEVIDYDTLSFLGVTDSVKTIGFQVYDINNDSIEHALNHRRLKLSKNHGLIQTFLFRDFPDFSVNWPYSNKSNEYVIKGISSPELGIQNLTWKDVFDDFYPGDELHVMGESCSGDIFDLYCWKRNSIFKYIDRIDYLDSLKYSIERIESIRSIHNGIMTGYEYIHDTIMSVLQFQSDNNFNKLSEESIIQGDVISYHLQSKTHLGSGKYVMTKTVDLHDHLQRISEDCWEPYLTGHYFLTDYEYMKGLGGPYYMGAMDNENFSKRRLVYYKKVDEEWGSPLTINDETGINIFDEPMISIFPNPARDYILVQADIEIPVLFEIVDLNGSVLITELIYSKKDQIDTSKLKAGVYIYRVRKRELLYQTGKLIIK